MLKFNNDHIITGYIKQLLADFNLPKYRVYTQENANYYKINHEEDQSIISTELSGLHQRIVPYIKDDKIQYYIDGKWVYAQHTYNYNKKVKNYTKNLQIKNNIYDSYTHEYLGNYLRFQRDYNNINLMPLYNCFSNKLVDKLNIKFNKTYSALVWQKLTATDTLEDNQVYKIFLPLNNSYDLSNLNGLNLDITSIGYVNFDQTSTVVDKAVGTTFLPTILPIDLVDEFNFANLQAGHARLIIDTAITGDYNIYNGVEDEHPEMTKNGTIYLYYNNARYKVIDNTGHSSGIIATFAISSQTGEKKEELKALLKNYSYKAVQNYLTAESEFSTEDANYKIYAVPVKLFKNYTIAIDSNKPIEMCCGIYNKYLDDRDKLKSISALTYKKYSMTYFDRPLLYTALTELYSLINNSSESEITTIDQNLKLFIKVPNDNKSSIVILEGNYTSFNNRFCYEDSHQNLIVKTNKSILNMEALDKLSSITPITNLQLLKINTGESYPFADRLIEYLTGNAVTHIDSNADNIKRVNTALKRNNIETDFPSVWDPIAQYTFYEYITNTKNTSDINHDVLGYVDKDVEKYYRTYQDKAKEEPCTLSNIDIYPDIYKDSKVKVKETK